MRLTSVILAIFSVTAILYFVACKKTDTPTPAIVEPEYRDKYTGVFKVTRITLFRNNPADTLTEDTLSIYTGLLTINYQTKDSIYASGHSGINARALHLIYENGDEQYMGIFKTGELFDSPSSTNPNVGGFITLDSINHYSTYYGANYIVSKKILIGKRVQ